MGSLGFHLDMSISVSTLRLFGTVGNTGAYVTKTTATGRLAARDGREARGATAGNEDHKAWARDGEFIGFVPPPVAVEHKRGGRE